ncbi:hypothetical protein HMH01_08345 [Halovulum dunhuangense]|uniref:Uncharacterized protein n=1 Tax=Halovulum dunhuangense TaxID=1505036 RepID=A0A849L2E6_9RHOB|nr:hypothetical protein [Halovulum dunhuangense]NNU80449.1 hypothetical protein [Halovulum dunhuangense]
MRADEKIALATGAGRGIGPAIAKACAAEAARPRGTDLDPVAAGSAAARTGESASPLAMFPRLPDDGVALGCPVPVRAMRSSGGTIVNIAGRAGHAGIRPTTADPAWKAAVLLACKDVHHMVGTGRPLDGGLLGRTAAWPQVAR